MSSPTIRRQLAGSTLSDMHRLSAEDVAAIVRRAVEVHNGVGSEALPGSLHDSTIDLATTQAVLRELGVSDDATGLAIAEWRSGMLAEREPRQVTAGWLPVAVASRVLPTDARTVRARLETELRRQCFTPARDPHGAEQWLARRGLAPQLKRSLDVRGTLALKHVPRLRVDVRPALGGAGARVTLAVDLHQERSALVAGFVGAPLVVTVAAFAVDPAVVDLLGAAVTGGGVLAARSRLGRRRRSVEELLHVVLEQIVRR